MSAATKPALLTRAVFLGRAKYERVYEIQKACVRNVLSQNPPRFDYLLLLEHDPVYTIGVRSREYLNTPNLAQRLQAAGADYVRTDRGGLITFHGPGQLVAYPILNLNTYSRMGVKTYVENLERALITTCKSYGLDAKTVACSPGVWIPEKHPKSGEPRVNKVAAIGIHKKHSVTYHGIALNCDVDMKWFTLVVPCGISDPQKGVTSLSIETGRPVTVRDAMANFTDAFHKVFGREIRFESVENRLDEFEQSLRAAESRVQQDLHNSK